MSCWHLKGRAHQEILPQWVTLMKLALISWQYVLVYSWKVSQSTESTLRNQVSVLSPPPLYIYMSLHLIRLSGCTCSSSDWWIAEAERCMFCLWAASTLKSSSSRRLGWSRSLVSFPSTAYLICRQIPPHAAFNYSLPFYLAGKVETVLFLQLSRAGFAPGASVTNR